MRTYQECIPCFIRQALDAARMATADEKAHEAVVKRIAILAAELDMRESPPVMGQKVHRLVKEISGVEDPYKEVKKKSNEMALRMYPALRRKIAKTTRPFEMALRLAIAGNIIDFGAPGAFWENDLKDTVDECLKADFFGNSPDELQNAVKNAVDILYITDNTGEIIFDHLLIDQLPIKKVTVAVRGAPIINDATMEDAECAGLTDMVEVIDNGSDAPGTVLDECSNNFLDRFESADLVIAKGQGNYETLSGIDKNIFFLLKIKCPVIARDIGGEVGSMVLKNSQSLVGGEKYATV